MLIRETRKTGMFRTCHDGISFGGPSNNEPYELLYKSVGKEVNEILTAFKTRNSTLDSLLAYDKYIRLSNVLLSYKSITPVFEFYRKFLTNAIEAAQMANSIHFEHTHKLAEIRLHYEKQMRIKNKNVFELMNVDKTIDIVPTLSPEIVEYVKRGYKLVDKDGYLIPIDMDIIASIRLGLKL